ncbi:GGDEF domain-containing response regulator [Solimonas soli]|uniref:GGDEF domain-containing response regulator n=1 Tax=Solimonas soli TaxID=413479 RepID=UPI0004888978|nr:diguanylate cyclase [Solimonas soli]
MNDTYPRLLIADDQAAERHVLQQIFAADYVVALASSGEEALALSAADTPNLILLDVEMPGIGGLETCRRLRARPATASVPVIFVTSHDEPEYEAAGLLAGATDFIGKPVHPDVVRMRVRTQLQLRLHSERLESLAFQDSLTGVFNRRYFDLHLEHEWQIARRNSTPLSLVFIDVDRFKSYNDRFGHTRGDQCLREIASLLSSALRRPQDFVARYGGEEFACLLPSTDAPAAARTAEYLRQRIEAAEIGGRHDLRVTISAGVASQIPDHGLEARILVERADRHLYLAKKNGRNRVSA